MSPEIKLIEERNVFMYRDGEFACNINLIPDRSPEELVSAAARALKISEDEVRNCLKRGETISWEKQSVK